MRFSYIIFFTLALTITSCSTNNVKDEETLFENEENTEEIALTISEIETQLFETVNDYRIANGLNALSFSNETYKYAKEHTQFMIIEDEISHDNFSNRATKIAKDTNATHVAENVAKNYPTPETALQGWLDSESHKRTIEGDFSHTAISIKENSEGKLFYTQIFLKK